jgi:hypothetical protein
VLTLIPPGLLHSRLAESSHALTACGFAADCEGGGSDHDLAQRLSQRRCQAASGPPHAWLHIDRSAAWAQPEHSLCCGVGETVPLADAVPNILLDLLSQSKTMLPLAVWQSTCDKLERRWAALAQNATAYAKASKLP